MADNSAMSAGAGRPPRAGRAHAARLVRGALTALGCKTTLVTGPTQLADPAGCDVIHIESARDMLTAVEGALPADIAVCAAAVADWLTADEQAQKIKKQAGGEPPAGPPCRTIDRRGADSGPPAHPQAQRGRPCSTISSPRSRR